MKNLKLKAQELGADEILTRDELKGTMIGNAILRSGCSASITCPDGKEYGCDCTDGTCSSGQTSISCDCTVSGTGSSGSSYSYPVHVYISCDSGEGSGSGSSSGSGSGSGSGSSGGGSGSGSGSSGDFTVTVTNDTNFPVTIKIDSVNYTCPGQFAPYTVPVMLNTGNHIFNFPCLVGGILLYYTIDTNQTACDTDITKYISANVQITISLTP